MNSFKTHTSLALMMGLLFSTCNPTCELEGDISISTPFTQPGFKVNITANPISLLKGKVVYFGSVKAENVIFREDSGLEVVVPITATSSDDVRIEDPDCGAIRVLKCTAREKSFYATNPKFITPMIPEIIIPAPSPLPFPPTIDKAWLSVEDARYCVWFDLKKDTLKDATGKPVIRNGKIVPDTTKSIDPKSSFEQYTCDAKASSPYKRYPMYGTYDKKAPAGTLALHFFIDRTEGGKGIEEYEGFFVDVDKQVPKYINIGETQHPCDPDPKKKTRLIDKRMLMITSKTTGLKSLIYHSGLGQP